MQREQGKEEKLVDFEKAVICAARTVFPNAVVRGCVFHWKQCLFTNVVPAVSAGHLTNQNPGRSDSKSAQLEHLKLALTNYDTAGLPDYIWTIRQEQEGAPGQGQTPRSEPCAEWAESSWSVPPMATVVGEL